MILRAFSDSSSLRQGFHEATFPHNPLLQKVSSVRISPARVKAAAWRAYVRESCPGARACVQCVRAVRAKLVLVPAEERLKLLPAQSVRICQN